MKQFERDILILGLIAYVFGNEGKKFSNIIGNEYNNQVADKLELLFKDDTTLKDKIKDLAIDTLSRVKKKLK